MDKKSLNREMIFGKGQFGDSINSNMDKSVVQKTNSLYWDIKGNEYLEAIVLPFYGAYVSEDKCQLFGDVSGKKAAGARVR